MGEVQVRVLGNLKLEVFGAGFVILLGASGNGRAGYCLPEWRRAR